jgi:hypothetical protein
MSELVQARQVDNRLAPQRIPSRALPNIEPERIHVSTDEHGRALAAVCNERPHLAERIVVWRRPVHADHGILFTRRLEIE